MIHETECQQGKILMSKVLSIENLHVAIGGKEILRGVDLTIRQGEVHALMGPNGSGKSTLSYALMGHPNYEVTEGSVTLDGQDILALEPDERAKAGLFLAFQYPTSIPGRHGRQFPAARRHQRPQPGPQGGGGPDPDARVPQGAPRADGRAGHGPRSSPAATSTRASPAARRSGPRSFSSPCCGRRSPSSTRPIAASTSTPCGSSPRGSTGSRPGMRTGILVITHYERILTYIKPQFVHILFGGRIVENGGPELVKLLESEGYDWVREKYPEAAQDEEALEAGSPEQHQSRAAVRQSF